MNQNPTLVAGDVHTHVWAPEHMSAEFRRDLIRAWPSAADVVADYETHATHASGARRSVVLAFDAPHSGLVVPDEFVAAYVARDPKRLVGFLSVDPRRPDASDRLSRGVQELGLRGVKLMPTYQGFDPHSVEAFRFYELVAKNQLPMLWHQGVTFVRRSVLDYAMPRLVDKVATEFPETPLVIAHLGHPWIDECIAVIRKHPKLFADISALTSRPLQFRQGLITAGEYGCSQKLLFGTDFPFDTIGRTLEVLSGWAKDPNSPSPLVETATAILTTDPLSVLGLD